MTELVPVPPLSGHHLSVLLIQIGVLLSVALLLGRLAVRAGMPPLAGELLTGIVLGPSLLGLAFPAAMESLFPSDPLQFHLMDAVGQIGVLLLVAITGMQLDFRMIRKRAGTAVRVSIPGLVFPLGLGVAAGLLLPAALLGPGTDRTVFALFLGVAMCVTAIPVIAKTLMDLKLMHRNIGQLTLMAGTVDDVLGWLGLSIVTAMATTGLRAESVVRSVVFLVVFVAVAGLIGRRVVAWLLRATLRSTQPGTTMTVAMVIVVSLSAVTGVLGLEAVFGALVAGILIQGAGEETVRRLAGLRTFAMATLVPVFFATAGLRMDLTALADPAVLLVALILLLVAVIGKFAGAFVGAWLSGLNRWEALGLGAGMNSRGVVQVIVAMIGVRLGVISTSIYTIIVLIAIVTSLMGPPILRWAMSRVELTAEERLRHSAQESVSDPASGRHDIDTRQTAATTAGTAEEDSRR